MESSPEAALIIADRPRKSNLFKTTSTQSVKTNASEDHEIIDNLTWRQRLTSAVQKLTQSSKFKKGSRYFYLLIAFVFYTAAGAKIFQVLEQDLALQVARQTGDLLLQERLNFIKLIENSTPDNWTVFAKGLAQYEAALVAAADAGVQVLLQVQEDGSTAITTVSEDPWTYELSVFFAATVLTTIGYGDVAPVTVWGRVFCIGFALLGIPLSLSFIAATGDLLASFAAYLPIKSISAAIPKGKRRTLVAGLGTVSLLLGFIAVGGVMFHLLEDWQFLDAFYFCFITTTTIGFGDFVPSPDSLRYCTAYIMLGLAITSTVIELVRRQYAESWARMQELSSRLHGLSSPLAVALRRMALTGATEMDLDPELMRQLRDMNRALAEADHRDVEDDPWDELLIMAEKKKRITFVMYESAL